MCHTLCAYEHGVMSAVLSRPSRLCAKVPCPPSRHYPIVRSRPNLALIAACRPPQRTRTAAIDPRPPLRADAATRHNAASAGCGPASSYPIPASRSHRSNLNEAQPLASLVSSSQRLSAGRPKTTSPPRTLARMARLLCHQHPRYAQAPQTPLSRSRHPTLASHLPCLSSQCPG